MARGWIWPLGHNLLTPKLKDEGILISKDKNSLNCYGPGGHFRDAWKQKCKRRVLDFIH